MTLFGIPSKPVEIDVAENMIFKNITVFALNGRRIWDTWYKTRWLLESGVVNVEPLITHQMQFEQVNEAMELLADGSACKIVLLPDGKLQTQVPKAESGVTDDANIKGSVIHP